MSGEVNLYEFPTGYTGRKTYVPVAGHAKLVACIYAYMGVDRKYRLHPDFGGDYSGVGARSDVIKVPYIMKSMGEYTSPVDGTRITDRSQHREHLKRHELIEVGNEPIGAMSRPEPAAATPGEIGARIKHHLDTVKAMPQKQYNAEVTKVQANG